MTDLRFPIGPFVWDKDARPVRRAELIGMLERAPADLRKAVDGLSKSQLERRYREGGWTLRQVVHHIADSHMNAFVRFKLALTEDNPTVKPYEEARWAELPDACKGTVSPSLHIMEGVHQRWVALMRSLKPADFARTYFHPEHQRKFTLDEVLALYAWHGRHHIAHIKQGVEIDERTKS